MNQKEVVKRLDKLVENTVGPDTILQPQYMKVRHWTENNNSVVSTIGHYHTLTVPPGRVYTIRGVSVQLITDGTAGNRTAVIQWTPCADGNTSAMVFTSPDVVASKYAMIHWAVGMNELTGVYGADTASWDAYMHSLPMPATLYEGEIFTIRIYTIIGDAWSFHVYYLDDANEKVKA
jgi:hypothetical protein